MTRLETQSAEGLLEGRAGVLAPALINPALRFELSKSSHRTHLHAFGRRCFFIFVLAAFIGSTSSPLCAHEAISVDVGVGEGVPDVVQRAHLRVSGVHAGEQVAEVERVLGQPAITTRFEGTSAESARDAPISRS